MTHSEDQEIAHRVEVDLHLHTTLSDGNLSPAELVRFCSEKGLKVIAITDHDSTNGIIEAVAAARSLGKITVIPGVELSAEEKGLEVHVLGYFVDHESPAFQELLEGFRDARLVRTHEIVRRLDEIGLPVSWERVKELAGGAVGRPHVAAAMVEAGYVSYNAEAFDKYLGRGGPAYVGRVRLSARDAVALLAAQGAVPVIAHPTFSLPESDRDDLSRLKPLLEELRRDGLAGIEVYYKDYEAHVVEQLESLAADLGLIPCGGTDYHASGNPGEPVPGHAGPPMASYERLKAAAGEVGKG